MIISKKTSFHSEENSQKKKNSWSYGQGILTEVLNPKTSLFFLSFLPQFVDPARGSAALQMLMLGSILILIALSADLLIAISGAILSKWITAHPVFQKIQLWIAGTVMIGLGIRLAISRRE